MLSSLLPSTGSFEKLIPAPLLATLAAGCTGASGSNGIAPRLACRPSMPRGTTARMRRSKQRLTLGLAATMVVTSACAPVYKTAYAYVPPAKQDGKVCAFQCDSGKVQCEQLEDMKQQACQQTAKAEYRECKSKPGAFCLEQQCGNERARCLENYHACFQMCGGKVVLEQRCVENCDWNDVPPETRNRSASSSATPAAPLAAIEKPQPTPAAPAGAVQCSSCGTMTPRGQFCSACGKRLAEVCACGAHLTHGAKFCSACGRPVTGSAPPPAETPAEAASE